MRTTIRLDDELLAQAKQHAARTGTTMTGLIETALRRVLAGRSDARPRSRVRLTTIGGKGLLPGVDLDDSAALLDWMDRPNDPL
jgi:hypothetical protein